MGRTIDLEQAVICAAIQQLIRKAQPVKGDAVAGFSRGTRRDALELIVADLIRLTCSAQETASIVAALFVGTAGNASAGVRTLPGRVAKHVLSALTTRAITSIITTNLTVAIGATGSSTSVGHGVAQRIVDDVIATQTRTA